MDTEKPAVKKAPKKVAAVKIESDKPVLRRPLEHGEKGPAVLWLQNRLTELGFYEKTPDGRFGTLTAKAVRRWQESHQLKLTGVIREHEWSLL
jgi:peptidoglycan hydrolase-like protein with peptidoglycan-binding domain